MSRVRGKRCDMLRVGHYWESAFFHCGLPGCCIQHNYAGVYGEEIVLVLRLPRSRKRDMEPRETSYKLQYVLNQPLNP